MKHVYNFKMTVADYRDMAVCRTFGTAPWRRYFMGAAWAIFAILLVLHFTHIITLSSTVYVCALLVTVIVAAAVITMEINIHKYKEAYKNGFNAERQIVVTEEGFTFRNRGTDEAGSNPWSEISRLEEMPKIFVIQLGAREAVILPKRAMGTQAKVDEFISVVNQYIPDRFHPLKKKDKAKTA